MQRTGDKLRMQSIFGLRRLPLWPVLCSGRSPDRATGLTAGFRHGNDRRSPLPRRATAGFTLPELLVALAIFATVMSGLFLLFNGVNRTVRQNTAITENFEIGRSLLYVMQEDLLSAFTAREYGDKYQFYGRPDGFMFVGNRSGGGLRRINYVICRSPGVAGEQFRTVIMERPSDVAERIQAQAREEAVRRNLSREDQELAPQTALQAYLAAYDTGEDLPIEHQAVVTTGALLRYEEDKNNLDSFDGFTAAWLDEDSEFSMFPELMEMLQLARTVRTAANPDRQLHTIDAGVIQTMMDARRRQAWLEVLSWNFEGATAGKNPRDYVIADRILLSANPLNPDTGAPLFLPPPLPPGILMDIMYLPAYFYYGKGDIGSDRQVLLKSYFNANENLDPLDMGGGDVGYLDFLRAPSPDMLVAFDRTLTRARQDKSRSSLAGSPLDPALPYVVVPGFWIMMERTQIGMADLRRWFSQMVHVPSAFTRAPVEELQVRRQ